MGFISENDKHKKSEKQIQQSKELECMEIKWRVKTRKINKHSEEFYSLDKITLGDKTNNFQICLNVAKFSSKNGKKMNL